MLSLRGNLNFVIAVLVLFDSASSFRILLIPVLGKSHVLSLFYIGEGLVIRGHEVTILLSKDFNMPSQLATNASGIRVELYGEAKRKRQTWEDQDPFIRSLAQTALENRLSFAEMVRIAQPMAVRQRSLLLNDDALLERLRAHRFDMAVVDHAVYKNYGYLIPHSLGVPWITYTNVIEPWSVRVPNLPSFVPVKILPFSDRMCFTERFINTFAYAVFKKYTGVTDLPDHLLAKYREYGEFSSMDDLQSRSLLFISTSDLVLDYAAPSVPNLIHVGGLSVKPTIGKALPKEIERFVASRTGGVILMTFGSMVSNLPIDITQKFLDAFQKLSEYRIIWRFENKEKLMFPDNVMLLKWLPQNDILADPRLKLFITHCGTNGQFEAVYHAVPMIGFPLFSDQPFNAVRMTYKGYGVSMDIHAFTAGELVDNVRTIIGDQSYKARISKASEIFRSARDTPAERAAYWIEHVTKFGGEHLRSAGNDLYLYQYLMLDVLLVVVVVIVTSLVCCYKLLQLAWRRCHRGRQRKQKSV